MKRNEGLENQWSKNSHSDADSYTSDQQSTYNSQAQPGNRPSGNRATHDAQGNGNFPSPTLKPAVPDCEGMQLARNPYDADNYLQVKRDQWDNEIPKDRSTHTPMRADSGSFGGRQYAEFQRNAQDGYGVEIPHGQSAAQNVPSTVWVDVSKADRGREG